MTTRCLAVSGGDIIDKCADKGSQAGFSIIRFTALYNSHTCLLTPYVMTSAAEFQQPIRNVVTLVTMVTVNRPLNVT